MTYKCGDMIGLYTIIRWIGQGGLCTVYLARNPQGKEVAIKVSNHDPLVIEYVAQEAFVLYGLGFCEHIPAYIDAGITESEKIYIVMEYVSHANDLLNFAKERHTYKALNWRLAVNILIQISRALGHAHRLKVIHRDLKPENILITRATSGYVVAHLIDFGLAWVENPTLKLPGKPRMPVNTVAGTPQFMSPEQINGMPFDARTDVFALGLILYYLIRGEDFYPSFNPRQACRSSYAVQRSKAVGRIHVPISEVPPRVWRVVKDCLAMNPTKRPRDGFALAARLERAVRQSKRDRKY